MSQATGYQCCFCGEGIAPIPPDVVSLVYGTCLGGAAEFQHEQTLFCHHRCIASKLHPKAKLYAADLCEDAWKRQRPQ